MARWYQTSQPGFLDDKILQLPWQLMASNLQAKDKAVDDTIASSVTLLDKLKAQGLQQDNPRLQEIVSGYETKVNDIVGNIRKNPMEHNKQSDTIRQLGRDIAKDWTTGEVSAIEGNRKAYIDAIKTNEELSKKDPEKYTQDYINALNKASLSAYKGAGYNPQTGQYNTYAHQNAIGMDNLNSWVDERLKGAIPDVKNIKKDTVSGKWIITNTKGTKKEMSEQELKGILDKSFGADTNLQNALQHRSTLGLPGFDDVLSDTGFNTNTGLLGNAFDAGLKKFGFTETTDERTLKDNPYGLKDYDEYLRKQREKEEEDLLTWNTKGVITGVQGNTAADFNDKRNNIMTTIGTTKDQMYSIMAGQLGFPSFEAMRADKNGAKLITQISKGNFSGVPDTPETRRLKNQYHQAKLDLAGQEAYKEQFKKDTGVDYNQVGTNGMYTQLWDSYIKSTPNIVVDQKASREGFGTNKQWDNTAKQFIDGGYYKMADLNIPKGTIIGGKDVGGKGYSFNDLVKQGIIINEPVKVPVIGKKGVDRKNDKGEIIKAAEYELQYKLADGTGTIGFSASANSLAPVTGLNDDGNIDLGFVYNLRGTEHFGRADEATTKNIKDFKRENNKLLRTRLQLQRYNNVESVTIPGPNNTKLIYHGRPGSDAKGKFEAGTIDVPKGDGTYIRVNVGDPGVEDTLSTIMYGEN